MAFTVIYDACVLYPAPLRDLLIRLALTGLVRAKWTEEILEECFRSILQDRPDLSMERLARTRELLRTVVPDCLVENYRVLVPVLTLPDADDRHVLAAAIRAGAQEIVTANLKDFPKERLEPYGVTAIHPDDFVAGLIDLAPHRVGQVLSEQANALKSPPRSVDDLLDILLQNGLVRSVALLKDLRLG